MPVNSWGYFITLETKPIFKDTHTQYQDVGQVEAENMFFKVCMDAITVNS